MAIRAQFHADNKVMLAADIYFPEPIGVLRAAMLLSFEDGLIHQNEMFYDGAQITSKKDEIFKKK